MNDDIVTRLRAVVLQAADEIERLRAERDDARRMVCCFESSLDREHGNIDSRFSPDALAAERGWDCFKEDGK